MKRLCFSADALVAFGIALGASVASAQAPRAAETVDLGNGVTVSLVRAEAGVFNQGSPDTEPGRAADEKQRSVTLTRPFYIGKFPVTVGQFVRFTAETRYRTEAETGTSGGYGWDGTKLTQRREFTWRNPGFAQTDEHPVVLVTYPDAEAFAAWLTRKSGRKFQLPTEAQWEYACRAGTTGAFPFGESRQEAERSIWHKGNSGNGTQPVGRMKPNAWGMHDMLGQVWEWCQDMYGPYQAGPTVDPLALQPGAGERPRRVLRGGSWLKDLDSCRAATRYRNDPRSRNADNGFRVVTFDELPAASPVQPTVAPPLTDPKLEREDDAVRSTGPIETGPVHRPIERRSSSKGVSAIGLIVGLALLFIVFRIVRSLLRATLTQPAETVGSLLSAAPKRGGHSGPLSTRIVEDGFWIQSGELPPGALVTCRYTIDAGPQETNIRFEPGSEGHFVYTGSRPRSVSVVVAPGGGPTHITRESPPSFQRRRRDDDDERFRGFPPAY